METVSTVKHLDDRTFAAAVGAGVVLIDFWAEWCGPCRMQGPILDDVADAIGDAATIAKVDVDEARQVAGAFGIRSIPTLVILKDGQLVERFVGVQTADALLSALRNAGADAR